MDFKQNLKYLIWVGLYAVLVVPFIVANHMFFPYIVGKAFTFRIIVEIIFGLWLILIIKDKEFRPKWSWVLGTAGIFVFVLLLADINAVAPFKAFWSNFERMEGWVTFIHLLAYFLVTSSMFNKEKLWLWFLRANLLVATILAIVSIDGATETRFSGPLGNSIYIAVYFMFITFFALLVLYKDVLAKDLKNWSDFRKVFLNILFYIYLAVAGLSLFVVYRTSRGALLGVIGGIFVAAILIVIFEKERKALKQIALGGIVLVLVLIAGFWSFRNSNFVQNNVTLKRFAEISWSNVNGQARQLVWPMALKGFKEKPLLGWGQEGFNYVFNKYYDPGMYGQESWFDRAHNAPLDFLVASGLLGFLSYLSLFVLAIYLLWFKRNDFDITERAILSGLLIGYLFQALFVFDNLVSYIMFFTTLAYIHSRLTENQISKQAFGYLSGFVSDEEYQNYILIPAVILLTGVGVWFINVPGIKANYTLLETMNLIQNGQIAKGIDSAKLALSYNSVGGAEIREQLIAYAPSVINAKGLDQKIKLDYLNFSVDEILKQQESVPQDARYYYLLGALFNNTGNFELALKPVNEAIRLSPNKQDMHFELIKTLYGLGKKDEALAEAKFTYELDTRYDQAKSLYAELIKEKINSNPGYKAEGQKMLNDLNLK